MASLLTRNTDDNGIITLTLNAPDQRNSLSMAMLDALSDALADIATDDATRVVVLGAAGSVFCAGHNLREMRDQLGNHEFQLALFNQCSKVMQQIVNLPKPVI